jgi:hypothetical protein
MRYVGGGTVPNYPVVRRVTLRAFGADERFFRVPVRIEASRFCTRVDQTSFAPVNTLESPPYRAAARPQVG